MIPNELNFVLIGPGHAGTTWLGTQLRNTKDVFVTYECNYLTLGSNQEVVPCYDVYFEESRGRSILGEHSNSYIYHNGIPEKLFTLNKNMKIIIVIRNPWKRIVSSYFHDMRWGYLPRWVKLSMALDPELFSHRYIDAVMYVSNVKRYLSLFPSDQIYVFASPDCNMDLRKQFNDLLAFLGSSSDLPHEFDVPVNSRKSPLVRRMHRHATFGAPSLLRCICRMLDPLNVRLGRIVCPPSISSHDISILAKSYPTDEVSELMSLLKDHEIRGREFISDSTFTFPY